jgi:DNA recombination protein RmuC
MYLGLVPIVLIAVAGALATGVAWWWGSMRERARGAARIRDAEAGRASSEAEARVQQSLVAELRARVAEEQARADAATAMASLAERGRAGAEARAEESVRGLVEQRQLVQAAEVRMADAFKALAADALSRSSQDLVTMAAHRLEAMQAISAQDLQHRQATIEAVVAPVRESLARVDEKIAGFEKERGQAYGNVLAHLRQLESTQQRLHAETTNLTQALRAPATRGCWGEMQLKRVVEVAGMLEHCDFDKQVTLLGGPDEGRLRPDMVVNLPGGRRVVVDAKVPLEAYLQAVAATSEEERRAHLSDHARQVRAHLQKLGAKAYWQQLAGTPDFVVLFLPGESLYSAALEAAPSLITEGAQHKVLIATPTTLIALLQTIHAGWREERLAENAERISEQGRALHKAVTSLVAHWSKLGRALDAVTRNYNAAVGSLEGRVAPAVRRLEEMGAGSGKELAAVAAVEVAPRALDRWSALQETEQDEADRRQRANNDAEPVMLSSVGA